jgi:hypothetical protein
MIKIKKIYELISSFKKNNQTFGFSGLFETTAEPKYILLIFIN